MTPWRSVPRWCHQGDSDEFGLCFWAMVGNLLVANTGQLMSVGEIENAAREMIGFSPYDHTTDRGEVLETGFRYIAEKGWPGDPMLRVIWRPITVPEIPAAIEECGGVCAWCLLPEASEDAFSDDMLDCEPAYAHAVLLVEPDRLISWAEPYQFSPAWWNYFGRGVYAVRLVKE